MGCDRLAFLKMQEVRLHLKRMNSALKVSVAQMTCYIDKDQLCASAFKFFEAKKKDAHLENPSVYCKHCCKNVKVLKHTDIMLS